MVRIVLFCVLLLWGANFARADTGCLDFSATPDTYSAPAGDTFTVSTTYTNCGDESTIFIGSSFGSDDSVNISQINFYDPFFFLSPGDSVILDFADYTWDPSAPAGFIWNPTINVEYVAEVCGELGCEIVGGGFEFANFTATVQQPVPEPATLLLLSTGVAGLALRIRRRRARARS